MEKTALGFGAGLRRAHYAEIFADPSLAKRIDWFEVISENFMVEGGKALAILDRIRATHPVVAHGVSLSIGSTDRLDEGYLKKLKRLVERVTPAIVSDHLCWTSIDGKNAHDLLPLPYIASEVARIADRVRHVQDVLGRRILLENVSSYLQWHVNAMPEWEFLAGIAEAADCGILLDVNNVYVSAKNHRFEAHTYLAGIPVERVGQFHLAGHSDRGEYLLDTHDEPVPPAVWQLYREAVARFGSEVPTLLEWDDKLPTFARLVAEVDSARSWARGGSWVPARTPARSRAPEQYLDVAAGQRAFFDALAAPEGPAGNDTVFDLVSSDGKRVEVYANMYFARLHDALKEDFPALFAALGADRFHDLATDYLWVYPSESWTLRDLGARLPAFLRAPDEKASRTRRFSAEMPWLADLAALEWARVEAFDAADAPSLAADALASLAPEKWAGLVLRAHPSLRVVACGWRVDAPWKDADEGRAVAPPARETGAIRVWREDETVYHAWIEPLEARLLARVSEGASFASLCEIPEGTPEEAAATVVALLRAWLADELLAA